MLSAALSKLGLPNLSLLLLFPPSNLQMKQKWKEAKSIASKNLGLSGRQEDSKETTSQMMPVFVRVTGEFL